MPEKKLSVEKFVKKILKEIPRELLELFYSEELPSKLANICFDCGLRDEEKLKNIGIQIGKVLYGGLPPEKLLDALKKEVELPPITATKIFREIDSQIFSTVRGSLNNLYKKEKKVEKLEVKPFIKTKESKEEKPSVPKKTDIYREPIE